MTGSWYATEHEATSFWPNGCFHWNCAKYLFYSVGSNFHSLLKRIPGVVFLMSQIYNIEWFSHKVKEGTIWLNIAYPHRNLKYQFWIFEFLTQKKPCWDICNILCLSLQIGDPVDVQKWFGTVYISVCVGGSRSPLSVGGSRSPLSQLWLLFL